MKHTEKGPDVGQQQKIKEPQKLVTQAKTQQLPRCEQNCTSHRTTEKKKRGGSVGGAGKIAQRKGHSCALSVSQVNK